MQALLRVLATGRDVAELGAAKDDLTPGRPIDGDAVREFLLRDPRLAAAEILAKPALAVIVASRLR